MGGGKCPGGNCHKKGGGKCPDGNCHTTIVTLDTVDSIRNSCDVLSFRRTAISCCNRLDILADYEVRCQRSQWNAKNTHHYHQCSAVVNNVIELSYTLPKLSTFTFNLNICLY